MKKVHEYCSYCEQEVKLDNELKVQICPNCGAPIIPCSICPTEKCANCPLDAVCQSRCAEYDKKRKEQEYIRKDIISQLIKITNDKNGRLLLSKNGIILDTCDSEHRANLKVKELTTSFSNNVLHAKTNWGLVILEKVVTGMDDWHTIEDVVIDLYVK